MVEFNQRDDDQCHLSLATNNYNDACLVLHAPLVVERISSKFLTRFERLSSEGGGKPGKFQLRSHGQELVLSPSLQRISFPCPCMSFPISVL